MDEEQREVAATVAAPPGSARWSRRRSRTLRGALATLVAAVLLPLIIAGIVFIGIQWRQQRDAAIARLQEHARTLQRAVDRELSLDLAVLRGLAAAREIDDGNWQAFHSLAANVAEARPGSWVALYEPGGQNVVNTRVPFGEPLPNLRQLRSSRADADWEGRKIPLLDLACLFGPLETGKPCFSGLVYGVVTRRPAVGTIVPVVRGGRPVYVLALVYSSQFFESLLLAERAPAEAIAGMWDARGLFLARGRDSERFVGLPGPEPFKHGVAALPREGLGETLNIESIPFLFAYSRCNVTDYVVSVGMPRAAVLAPAWRALWLWLGVLVAAGAAGAFFALRLWRSVGNPLVALAQQARAAGEGQQDEVSTGIEEVEALRDALRERSRAEVAFRKSEARLRLALDAAKFGTFELDVATGHLVWDLPKMRMWGIAAPEEFRYPEVLDRIHRDDRGRVEAAVESSLRTGKYEAEYRVIWPDGSVHWLYARGRVEFDGGEPTRMLGVEVDVTERKLAEEALRASEERWNAAIENFSEGAIIATEAEQVIYWNPAARAMHGFTSEREGIEPLAKTPETFELWTPDGAHLLSLDEWPMRRIKRGETVRGLELRLRRPDQGWERFVAYSGAMVQTSAGERLIFLSVTDLTERRRAEFALREADRRKDEFLGMLSHELRNPLAPIRSSVYVLHHSEPTSDQARRARAVIDRQSEHLARIVDDLLDVTRIARGKIILHRNRVDLREVVHRAVEDAHLPIESRGVRLHLSLPQNQLWTDADATRITQIVGNLLANARKFTHEGDEVAVMLREVDGKAEITVRDTGAGIDPALLPNLFEAFVQGERTLARSEGGLGLGLALVKGLVELHGGSVEARSEGVGRGAEFIVRLPLIAPLVDEQPSHAAPSRAANARHVLVVDDNADAAESLAELVSLLGHTVEVAYDGPSAIEKVRHRRPDVVLCDLGLPGMTGYEVAQALRAEHDSELRLVAVSGYAQAEDVARATAAGFDAHVAKPSDPEKIERLLS